ncbi:2-acylglycerol O-acyltransferase 1-like [Harmonia axyridis]|uniref:2-acylglycerol O-acyltransferase 1-like n=1 Tax=Harmonia axyridis TaxID=115357 RepID=UPI001E2792F0|nr:2-acylglycerol O-acyltransferase 1-like [Harmonia axyridis]XP_045467428.1 2-acylglycerol O-acyltransferase 1-like [Harmonia axyridis]XP_045467429.1 2-acylglycerol O-acyltransferase 1-like [Harmonia axyridis]
MGLQVEFAPLNVPLTRRLQTLSAAFWFSSVAFAGLACWLLILYVIFYTRLWWLIILYLVWVYIDRHACETGSRRSSLVRSWDWWEYFRNYFPVRLHRLPWIEFDPDKNYLFCCFPHGLIPAGAFSVFATKSGEFEEYFPGLNPWLCILEQHLHTPIFREMLLMLGCISPSLKSLNQFLSKPGGGNAVALVVGGIQEAYYSRPGRHQLVLKNRKGFVKVALQNGSPLVPVYSFGENEIFDQIQGADDSLFKKTQEFIRKIIGLAPIIPLGRGLLQYSYGIVPHRRPVNVVVGHPIPVEKIENPTPSQIDDLHQKFIEAIMNIFETHKFTYLENPEDAHLKLV